MQLQTPMDVIRLARIKSITQRENPPKFQIIELEQLSSLVGSHKQVADYHLYCLNIVEENDDYSTSTLTTLPQRQGIKDAHLQSLLKAYQDLFQEPKRLPPPRTHDYKIPLREGSEVVNQRPYRYSCL